ncbi:MAG: pimeloyl-[acyl-carrier protein] methyl ester esterase [Planctomycetota bacterium]|jgi:pimeloyl-[acyl-carrier protein] methyl ester esterase
MIYTSAMSERKTIFLHGWGMNACIFDPLIELIGDRVATVNVSLPGYAGSHWSAAFPFEEQLELMAQDLPAGQLTGWSMGGLYAIELASRYPQKFDELTLVASNPCFVKRGDWKYAVDESVFDAFAGQLSVGWQATMRRFLSLQMLGVADGREQVRAITRQMARVGEPGVEVLQQGLALLKSRDSRATLAGLRQPVRIILGERDALVPIALKQQIADLNPKFQVESQPGAAHAPFLSHPESFVSLLLDPVEYRKST